MKDRSKSFRAERVGERVREEMMAVLLGASLEGSVLKHATVTAVRMTPDLRVAHVLVGASLGSVEGVEPTKILAALKTKSSWLRKQLGRRLALRYVPELRFVWDTQSEHILRLEQLLDDIHDG